MKIEGFEQTRLRACIRAPKMSGMDLAMTMMRKALVEQQAKALDYAMLADSPNEHVNCRSTMVPIEPDIWTPNRYKILGESDGRPITGSAANHFL